MNTQVNDIPIVAAAEVAAMQQRGEPVELVDVRTPVEFAEVHAVGTRSMPLDRLDAAALENGAGRGVYVMCRSGARAQQACRRLREAGVDAVCVAGGLDAWLAAGLPVERQAGVISLERQVRIGAGLMVLAGVIGGTWLNPWCYALSAFVGAGLVFAGVTNFCGMGLLLAKMPWNRYQPAACSR